MTRESHTAEDIRAEVERLLNKGRMVPLTVPLPVPAKRDPAKTNANWDMPALRTRTGKQIDIGLALLSVKMRWDLKD